MQLHELPAALRPLTHPVLVATFFAIPLALWAWRSRFELGAERAIALLALLALLRCALDPVDNLYYHAPLILSLLAWDAVRPIGRLPSRGLCGCALALIFWRWSLNLGNIDLFNAAYVATVVVATAAITSRVVGKRRGSTARAHVVEIMKGT